MAALTTLFTKLTATHDAIDADVLDTEDFGIDGGALTEDDAYVREDIARKLAQARDAYADALQMVEDAR